MSKPRALALPKGNTGLNLFLLRIKQRSNRTASPYLSESQPRVTSVACMFQGTIECLNSAFYTGCLKPLSGSLVCVRNIFPKNLSEIRKFLSKNKPFHHASQPLPLCNYECIPCKQQFKGCGKKRGTSWGRAASPHIGPQVAHPSPSSHKFVFLSCIRKSNGQGHLLSLKCNSLSLL